jgi:iron complex outermembrane receptor protein
MPFRVDNKMKGETYGLEVAADWRAMDWWQLQLAYTYLQMQLTLDGDSQDTVSEAIEGDSPEHHVSLRSKMDIPGNIEFDWWLRYMDKLPNNDVDSYITLDVLLGWKPIENLEFAIVGQNLLDDQHPEFTSEFIKSLPAEIERGVYGKITWRF